MAVCRPGLGSLEATLRQGFPSMPSIKAVLLGETGEGMGEAGQGRKDGTEACCLGQSSPKVSFRLILQGRSGVEAMLQILSA